jgi:DNA primase
MINIQKNKYHCWVCDRSFSGDLNELIKRYATASQLVYWYELNKQNIQSLIKEKNNIKVSLPRDALSFLDDSVYKQLFKNYLYNRGLYDYHIQKYQLYFCVQNEYKNRIIIPSFDIDGQLNYFIARSIDDDSNRKYLAAPANKNEIIFNELFVNWNYPVILVEGVFDAMKVDCNAIPLLGTSLDNTAILNKILMKHPTVFMMLDKDARIKQLSFIEELIKRNIKVFDVKINSKDPGSMTELAIQKSIKEANEQSEHDVLLNKIQAIINE